MDNGFQADISLAPPLHCSLAAPAPEQLCSGVLMELFCRKNWSKLKDLRNLKDKKGNCGEDSLGGCEGGMIDFKLV